jgi:hypothetical protein
MNPFFSKKSAVKLEPIIRSGIKKFLARLEEFRQTQQPLNTAYAFNTLTTDIITTYAFAKSYNFLAAPDFYSDIYDGVVMFSASSHLNKQVP